MNENGWVNCLLIDSSVGLHSVMLVVCTTACHYPCHKSCLAGVTQMCIGGKVRGYMVMFLEEEQSSLIPRRPGNETRNNYMTIALMSVWLHLNC